MVNAVLTLFGSRRDVVYTAPYPSYDHAQLQQRNFALMALGRGLESALWILIILFFSGAIIGLTFTAVEQMELGDNA